MLLLLGVNLPDQKVVSVALTYFYGIGPLTARRICSRLSLHRECKLSELSEGQLNQLSTVLSEMTIENDLKRQIGANVQHLREIGTYVGKRHAMGLPVHGQRTRNNSKTAKRFNGIWLRKYSAPAGLGIFSSPLSGRQRSTKAAGDMAGAVTEQVAAAAAATGQAVVSDEAARRGNALKLEANALYAKRQYHEAIEKYTLAIESDPTVAAYYTNRAQCHLHTEGYGAARDDANAALALDPGFIKGYYRRASAHSFLGMLKEARADYREVVRRLPNDAGARQKYAECDKLYRRLQFEKAIDSEADRKRVADSVDLAKFSVPEDYQGPRMPLRRRLVPKPKPKQQPEAEAGAEPPEMVEVEEEYVDLAFVEGLADWFRDEKKLPERYMYAILLQADRLLRQLPTLVDVAIPDDAVLTVCGDVHGQYYDVLNIFKLNGFPSAKLMYLFNGDFVDRGSFSVEVIMLFLSLKLLYPDAFFLNRGNHESVGMNQLYGFQGEVKAKYPVQGAWLFALFQETFEALPIAHLIQDKIFVVHGGLYSRSTARNSTQPDGDGVVRLAELRDMARFYQPSHNSLMCESLWSDPQPQDGRRPSPRGTAIQYGPDVTREFCEKNGLTMVIRSHQQVDEGYEIAHNGQMVTVFSAPNYCDAGTNKGAYIRITPALECTYHKFGAVPHPDVRAMAYANVGLHM
ncbi:Palmitoyl-protein thioesterase 1 [Coemansia javaensis]|uniref:Serine/threonine-protein phosphatase n=1 Tax=Coemansia javaensis TaxID=2761396 RepID=A0A9W8HEV0_9FUNG|nr:Palmitoyl-protein thioesterase 1 [Coemansia javaensis]